MEENGAGVAFEESDLEPLVRSFGKALSNAFMYGVDHGVTKGAIDETFVLFQSIFARTAELSFTVSDEALVINRVVVSQKNPLVRMFVTKVLGLKVGNLTLDRSLTVQQLSNLVEILNASAEELKQLGGFATFAEHVGLSAVKVRAVRFQEVTEDEEVITKGEGAGPGDGGEGADGTGQGDDGQGTGGADGDGDGDGAEDEGPKIENIVAFLKGTVEMSESVAQGIQDTAPDAQKLGELILQTAHMNVEQASVEGAESLTGLVVGCLRKTYQALKKSPTAKTQKGKKNLSKQLMLLEKEIIDKMREMGEGVGEEDLAMVENACEEILDEIKIEALATEYMKKRTQIETNERRIMRFMKGKTTEELEENELKDMLMAGGMTPDGWEELLVRSGAATGGGAGGAGDAGGGAADMGIAALGQLATLLTRMEETISSVASAGGEGAAVQETVKGVRSEVETLVAHTQGQIRDLVSSVHEDATRAAEVEADARRIGKGPQMSRKELLETLAEIVQELCQPLAVINCSVDMIKSGALGEVSSTQAEMLGLAAESSEKIQMLTDALQQIAGLPSTMTPDARLQSALYS